MDGRPHCYDEANFFIFVGKLSSGFPSKNVWPIKRGHRRDFLEKIYIGSSQDITFLSKFYLLALLRFLRLAAIRYCAAHYFVLIILAKEVSIFMKTLSLFSLFVLASSAWAASPAVDPNLSGQWKTVSPTDVAGGPDPSAAYETLQFNSDFTIATWTVTCIYSSGETLTASESNRVTVANGAIVILDSNSDESDDIDGVPGHVGRRCNVWVNAGTDNYTISNGLLVLTSASDGTQLSLKRQ